MRLYQRAGTWYTDIRHGGKRTRRSCGTGSRRDAEAVARRILIDLAIAPPSSGRSFYECLVVWARAETRNGTDQSIIRQVRARYPDRPATEVSDESLRKALSGLSAANYNRYLAVIRAALRLTIGNAAPTLRGRKTKEERLRYLNPAEWTRLRAMLPKHLIAPAEFSLATGLRQSNVFDLQWSQVDLRTKTVTIWADQAKGGKKLHLPLSTWATEILRGQIGQHLTHVFVYRKKPLESPKKAFRRAVEDAKLSGITWHTLRHTWASWAVQGGMPLPVLKELGGWATMDMVMRYAHLAPSHLARFADTVKAPKKAQKGTS